MRIPSPLLAFLTCVACLSALCAPTKGDNIEAVKGKQYKLTRRHGPWMIMVASFLPPPEERRSAGLTPEQAADELVYELRLKGIPAYTFKQQEPAEDEIRVKTVSRRTQSEREGKVRWIGGICVLAGNYPSNSDPVAQDTLKYIKRYRPRFLQDVAAEGAAGENGLFRLAKSGGVYRTTKDHPGPLSGAFMTTNPILSENDLALRTRDPLIVKLNSGNEYSLLQNRGKYTVVVATFLGKSQTQVAETADVGKLKLSNTLDDAMNRAWLLCTSLRRARSLGYPQDFEAYVYHDRFSSIVTVGSFNSHDDPRITEIQNKFGAKVAAVSAEGAPTMIGAEIFTVPKPDPAHPPTKDAMQTWIFDPYPQLIDVPR